MELRIALQGRLPVVPRARLDLEPPRVDFFRGSRRGERVDVGGGVGLDVAGVFGFADLWPARDLEGEVREEIWVELRIALQGRLPVVPRARLDLEPARVDRFRGRGEPSGECVDLGGEVGVDVAGAATSTGAALGLPRDLARQALARILLQTGVPLHRRLHGIPLPLFDLAPTCCLRRHPPLSVTFWKATRLARRARAPWIFVEACG